MFYKGLAHFAYDLEDNTKKKVLFGQGAHILGDITAQACLASVPNI